MLRDSSRERKMHGNRGKAKDRAEAEHEAEEEAETTTERDSHPDGKKEEVQDQEEDGTGKVQPTQDGRTTARTDPSPTNGRTGVDRGRQRNPTRTLAKSSLRAIRHSLRALQRSLRAF